MELWIRSQDRMALTKINSIGIEYDKSLVGYGKICVKLGEYETKERALKVLDEIQKCIVFSGVPHEQLLKEFDRTTHDVFFNDLSQVVVYEMPKE